MTSHRIVCWRRVSVCSTYSTLDTYGKQIKVLYLAVEPHFQLELRTRFSLVEMRLIITENGFTVVLQSVCYGSVTYHSVTLFPIRSVRDSIVPTFSQLINILSYIKVG